MASPEGKPVDIRPQPGLKRQSTQLAAEGFWYDSDKVRMRSGQPESMRGWQVRSGEYDGVARDLITWEDLNFNPLIGFGTECKLYLVKGGVTFDVTPIQYSGGVSISTSAGSNIVVVSGPHGTLSADDFVVLSSVNVGGLVVNGEYSATSVPSANEVWVSAASNASSTAVVSAQIDALLQCGPLNGYFGTGYGTGAYGAGTYGTGTGQYFFGPRVWTLDTWGEDMLANVRGGKIYLWDASAGPGVRAAEVSAAPSIVNAIMVSQQDRHAIALGATDEITGAFNPLLIRWCSQENLDDWATSIAGTAGSKEIKGGTQLMGGVNTKNGSVVFTDNAAHFLTYIGPPFTFGVTELGQGIGLIAPNAAADLDGIAYWMSKNGWYSYDGQVLPLADDIQRDVYNNLNITQQLKIVCGTNREMGELIWLYPSADSDEIDRYALYDTQSKSWMWGSFAWSAWADAGIFDNIIVANATDSRLYDHELPDYYEANGSPMNSWIESGAFDLGNGEKIMYTDRAIPDMQFDGTGGYVDMYLKFKKYPNSAEVVKGPFRITESTTKVAPRGRGRQASILIACSAGTAGWRSGLSRLYVKEDGFQ